MLHGKKTIRGENATSPLLKKKKSMIVHVCCVCMWCVHACSPIIGKRMCGARRGDWRARTQLSVLLLCLGTNRKFEEEAFNVEIGSDRAGGQGVDTLVRFA